MNFTKKSQNLDQKVNPQQNTVCLEQTNYASPKKFTPALLVMLETLRRSACQVITRVCMVQQNGLRSNTNLMNESSI